MKKQSLTPVEPLAVVPELDTPQVLTGRVDQLADGGNGTVISQGPKHALVLTDDVTDGVALDKNIQGGSDGDAHQPGMAGGCADLLSDGLQDHLSCFDTTRPADRDVLRVHITRVIEAGCVVLDVFDKLNRLANRLYRRHDIAGRLELADCIDECADELWQEGLNITVGAETCQQLIDSLFETRSDRTVAHRSAPCAEEER